MSWSGTLVYIVLSVCLSIYLASIAVGQQNVSSKTSFSPLSAKVNSLPLHSSTCGEGTTPAISKEHRTSETTKNGAGHAACNNISVWASMGDYFILFLGIRHALTAWESWHVRIFKTAGQIHKTNITSPQSLNCGRHCWIDFNLVS